MKLMGITAAFIAVVSHCSHAAVVNFDAIGEGFALELRYENLTVSASGTLNYSPSTTLGVVGNQDAFVDNDEALTFTFEGEGARDISFYVSHLGGIGLEPPMTAIVENKAGILGTFMIARKSSLDWSPYSLDPFIADTIVSRLTLLPTNESSLFSVRSISFTPVPLSPSIGYIAVALPFLGFKRLTPNQLLQRTPPRYALRRR